jgi:hypothetical protein
MNNKLRDFGMITERDYVGRELENAKLWAEAGGFSVRIVENNGESFMLTMDLKSDRINFRVKNDVVVGAYGG